MVCSLPSKLTGLGTLTSLSQPWRVAAFCTKFPCYLTIPPLFFFNYLFSPPITIYPISYITCFLLEHLVWVLFSWLGLTATGGGIRSVTDRPSCLLPSGCRHFTHAGESPSERETGPSLRAERFS